MNPRLGIKVEFLVVQRFLSGLLRGVNVNSSGPFGKMAPPPQRGSRFKMVFLRVACAIILGSTLAGAPVAANPLSPHRGVHRCGTFATSQEAVSYTHLTLPTKA